MTGTQSYFKYEKFVLRMLGVSFREDDSTVYKVLSKALLPIACLYPFLAAGDLFKHDFETVAELLTYEIPLFIGVAKILTLILYRKKITNVLNELDTDLSLAKFTSGNNQEEKLMKDCILITTAQTAGYLVCSCFCIFFAIGYTFLKRIRSSDYHDWQFPYGEFTILNVTYSPNFEISWLYQCLGAGCVAFNFVTIDVLMAAVLCHICFHLKILHSKFRTVVVENKKMENVDKSRVPTLVETVTCKDGETEPLEWKNLQVSLKAVVEYHMAIIDITKEVDESFSILLLLVFLGTLGILAFMVYTASLVPLTDVRMLRSMGELAVIIVQVFMVCFWSEQIMFESREVGAAAYGASFVGTDLRFQKSLILVMRRSQTPIRLTAGFVDISLATFTWILRSTYSAYMVLRKQNLPDD